MDELIERQRAFVAEHFALENAHNWAAVVESFTGADPVFELMPAAARFEGKAGIAASYNILATALPDVQLEIVRAVDAPGCAVREIVATGTHRGEFFGLPESGRRVRIEMACFFEFDQEGRLITERVYFDNSRVLAQMRGELEVEEQ